MCYKIYPIAQCQHRGPSKWAFCFNRTEIQTAANHPCTKLEPEEYKNDLEGVHGGHYVDFCCSKRCCDDDVRLTKQRADRARVAFVSLRSSKSQERYEKAEEELNRTESKHERCQQRRLAYMEMLFGEQPCLFL